MSPRRSRSISLFGSQFILFEVEVNADDYKRALGRSGRNIAAIRELAECIGAKRGLKFKLELVDPERQPEPQPAKHSLFDLWDKSVLTCSPIAPLGIFPAERFSPRHIVPVQADLGAVQKPRVLGESRSALCPVHNLGAKGWPKAGGFGPTSIEQFSSRSLSRGWVAANICRSWVLGSADSGPTVTFLRLFCVDVVRAIRYFPDSYKLEILLTARSVLEFPGDAMREGLNCDNCETAGN